MINPATIPRIDGDLAALSDHADDIEIAGIALAHTGARIHQTWQGIAAVYSAPEADQLFAATGPVMSVAASAGEDLENAAAALHTYVTETAAIQARLEALREDANQLVAAYDTAQDESTTITLDGRGVEVNAAVAAQIAEWEAAQRRCADALHALTRSSPTTVVAPEAGAGVDNSAIAPAGPLLEIYPIDETPPGSTTAHPPLVLGPQILVNVPAPPTTGVVDGPGSLVPPLGGSIIFDTSADATAPEGGESSPAPEPEPTEEPEPSPIGPPSEFDPEELRGLPPDDVRARIPADWVRKPSKSGGGDVYVDPDHYARQVRIMPGYPPGSRPDPTTWGPYAQISQNGQKVKIPLAGNPTLEGS